MLVIVTHKECLLHDNGPAHPESAERLDAINDQLIMSGMNIMVPVLDAPRATTQQLALAHDKSYIESVLSMTGKEETCEIDPETIVTAKSVPAVLRAAGAGVFAVDLTMNGEEGPVFCLVRPPGHHAMRAKGMAFCVFNNVAVAAHHALSAYSIERLAIADFDAHHGNGTEDIFRDDKRVLICSAFQHPFFPHTGEASETVNLVNVPLSGGAGSAAFRAAVAEHWLPALDAFRPQIIIISAGFDGHVLDDMSGLALTEADYSWVTTRLLDVAKSHADGRLVSMLEGGYEPGSTARSVVSHLKALLE